MKEKLIPTIEKFFNSTHKGLTCRVELKDDEYHLYINEDIIVSYELYTGYNPKYSFYNNNNELVYEARVDDFKSSFYFLIENFFTNFTIKIFWKKNIDLKYELMPTYFEMRYGTPLSCTTINVEYNFVV